MTILCNLLLIVVIAVSASIFPLWISSHNLIGPDRIAGPIVFFFLGSLRWLCFSVTLSVCASRGAFTRGSRSVVAATLMVAFAVLEILACVIVSEDAARHSEWLAHFMVLMSAAMPVPLACYMFWWLDLRPTETVAIPWVYWLAIGCSVALVPMGLALGSTADRLESQREKDPAYVTAKYLKSRTAELRSVRADDSGDGLGRWLVFTRPNEPEAIRAEALTAIAIRPKLVSDLTTSLEYLNLYDSGDAARYLGEMKPAPPEELAEPFQDYAGHVVEGMQKELAEGQLDEYFSEGAEAAVIGARALQVHGVDVRPQLQQMAALLRARNTDRTRAAVATIEGFLAANTDRFKS